MIPINPFLSAILNDMRHSTDITERARAENFLWDERGEGLRQTHYEEVINQWLDEETYKRWRQVHQDYLAMHVTIESPITFQDVNSDAGLSPKVWSDMGEDQVLMRIECLDWAVNTIKLESLATLKSALEIFVSKKPTDMVSVADAKALLTKLCESLNTSPNAVRPRFAAFAQELDEEIAADDWPDRLRDRLGLAHYPRNGMTRWPVALMAYTVKEVREGVDRTAAPQLLTVPTPLDDMPYEIFHPAPKGMDFGRTLHLGDNRECDKLASEVLHPRFNYAANHILKIGEISAPADVTSEKLAKLRETHIFCLRWHNQDRQDFGASPTP